MRRYCLLFIFLASLLSVAAQNGQSTVKAMKERLATLEEQINKSQEFLRTSQKDVKSRLRDLSILSRQIEERKNLIDTISAQIGGLDGVIEQLNQEIVKHGEQLEVAKKEYAKSLQYTRHGHSFEDRLMFILSAKSFNNMYRRFKYMGELAQAQRRQGLAIKAQMDSIAAQKQQVEEVRKGKEELRRQQSSQHEKLKKQEDSKQALVKELEKNQAKVQQELNRQRKEYQRLNAAIEQAIEQEIAAQRKREQEEAAARARAEREKSEREKAVTRKSTSKTTKSSKKSSKGGDNSTSTSSESGTASTPVEYKPDAATQRLSGSFRDNRGRLPVPITGSYAVVSSFGPQKGGYKGNVYTDNGGIEIQGKPGAQARAIFQGKVTHVYNKNGLAFVLVRHGSYISVYSGLSSISVSLGDEVRGGTILGNVATDGDGNTMLLFQLRNEKAKLNPLQWINF